MSQAACRSSLVANPMLPVPRRKSHVPRRQTQVANRMSRVARPQTQVARRQTPLTLQNLKLEKEKSPGDKNSPRPPERYEKLKYYLCCKDKTKIILSNIFLFFFNRILRLPSSLPERLLFGKSPCFAYKALITNEFQHS